MNLEILIQNDCTNTSFNFDGYMYPVSAFFVQRIFQCISFKLVLKCHAKHINTLYINKNIINSNKIQYDTCRNNSLKVLLQKLHVKYWEKVSFLLVTFPTDWRCSETQFESPILIMDQNKAKSVN